MLRRIAKRYPFLVVRNYNGKIIRPLYLYAYPDEDGWTKFFYYDMMEEIRAELVRTGCLNSFRIDDYKEKYGELRMYVHGYRDEGVLDIIDKYTVISHNVCIVCGRPNVPMVPKGYIYPSCEKHYKWNPYPGDDPISKEFTYRKFSDEGNVDVTVDISETVNKLVDRWNRKHVVR